MSWFVQSGSKKSCGAVVVLIALATSMTPSVASAHAFGQRYNLPLPLPLYLAAAAAAVGLSFVVIARFNRKPPDPHGYPNHDLLQSWLGRALFNRTTFAVLKIISAAMLAVVLMAGFFGNQDPISNIVPTLVWIIWWIGLAYVCALFGNLWAIMNPWSAIADGAYFAIHRWHPQALRRPTLRAPNWLGVWPAAGLLMLFGWSELVWPARAVPANIASAAVLYSIVTWTGMAVFGRREWLRRGEAFAVFFGLLAKFAPTELRVTNTRHCAACSDSACGNNSAGACVGCVECFQRARPAERQWNLRPFGAGLMQGRRAHFSELVFVLFALSIVTFDGFVETATWQRLFDATYYSKPALLFASTGLTQVVSLSSLIFTIGLLLVPGLFLLVYVVVAKLMALMTRQQTDNANEHRLGGVDIACIFVLSLVPIALGYHLAHYLTFLLTYGQLIIPLSSDPFGFGWNLLGTRGYEVNIGIVGAQFVWYTAISSVVVGHIIAVWIAHAVALQTFRNRALAIRSQYPLLTLMVGYTAVGLWILAQPIVA